MRWTSGPNRFYTGSSNLTNRGSLGTSKHLNRVQRWAAAITIPGAFRTTALDAVEANAELLPIAQHTSNPLSTCSSTPHGSSSIPPLSLPPLPSGKIQHKASRREPSSTAPPLYTCRPRQGQIHHQTRPDYIRHTCLHRRFGHQRQLHWSCSSCV